MILNNIARGVELDLAAEDVAEEMLDEAAGDGAASAAQAAVREAKNEELAKRLHHENKMSAAEEVCDDLAGECGCRAQSGGAKMPKTVTKVKNEEVSHLIYTMETIKWICSGSNWSQLVTGGNWLVTLVALVGLTIFAQP